MDNINSNITQCSPQHIRKQKKYIDSFYRKIDQLTNYVRIQTQNVNMSYMCKSVKTYYMLMLVGILDIYISKVECDRIFVHVHIHLTYA